MVVADLGQQPGAERNTQSGNAADDLPIGVGEERDVDLGLELGEAATHRVKLADQPAQLDSHCLLDRLWLVHLLGVEVAVESSGLGVDAALAAGLAQHPREATFGQPARLAWGGGRCQDRAAACRLQPVFAASFECCDRSGEERLEQRADAVRDGELVPDRVLLGAAEHLQRSDLFAVLGQRAVRVAVRAQDVGQHHRVEGVRLTARGPVAVAVSRHGEWVDSEHRPPCCAQASHQQPAIGLDRYLQLQAWWVVFSEELEQPGQACGVVADSFGGDHRAVLVHHGNVVVVLRPIDSAADCRHAAPSSRPGRWRGAGALMDSAHGTTSH